MAITNQQIVKKIMSECEKGLKNETHIREHAKAIQSLTELLLDQGISVDEASIPTSTSSIDDVEWRKMIGGNQQSPSTNQTKKIEDDDANGDSLLDF